MHPPESAETLISPQFNSDSRRRKETRQTVPRTRPSARSCSAEDVARRPGSRAATRLAVRGRAASRALAASLAGERAVRTAPSGHRRGPRLSLLLLCPAVSLGRVLLRTPRRSVCSAGTRVAMAMAVTTRARDLYVSICRFFFSGCGIYLHSCFLCFKRFVIYNNFSAW